MSFIDTVSVIYKDWILLVPNEIVENIKLRIPYGKTLLILKFVDCDRMNILVL